jgi:hypothetical protein
MHSSNRGIQSKIATGALILMLATLLFIWFSFRAYRLAKPSERP